MEEYIISDGSSRISELSAAGSLADADIIMISNRKVGKDGNNSSFMVTVADLYELIKAEMLKQLKPGGMAYESKVSYAREYHEHDFSRVSVGSCRFAAEQKIGTAVVSRDDGVVSSDIYVPDYTQIAQPEPYIGEIKNIVCAPKTKSEILESIADGTFDGWVFPDGSQYGKTMGKYDFTAAWTRYRNTDSTFIVPLIDNFVRLSGGAVASMASVPYSVGIKQHSHAIGAQAIPGSFTATAALYCNVTNTCDNTASNALHKGGGGNKTKANTHIKMEGSAVTSLDAVSGSVTSEMEECGEAYPSHNVIPCMVYIGKTPV